MFRKDQQILPAHLQNPKKRLPLQGHMRFDGGVSDHHQIPCGCCYQPYPVIYFFDPDFTYCGSGCCGAPICKSCKYQCEKKSMICKFCEGKICPDKKNGLDDHRDIYALHRGAAVWTARKSGENHMSNWFKRFQALVSFYAISKEIDRSAIWSFKMSKKDYQNNKTIVPFLFILYHKSADPTHAWLPNNRGFYHLHFFSELKYRNIMFTISSKKLFPRFLWDGKSSPLLSDKRRKSQMMEVVLAKFNKQSIRNFYSKFHNTYPGLPTYQFGAYDTMQNPNLSAGF
jgi:hypothetical protein